VPTNEGEISTIFIHSSEELLFPPRHHHSILGEGNDDHEYSRRNKFDFSFENSRNSLSERNEREKERHSQDPLPPPLAYRYFKNVSGFPPEFSDQMKG
jgi:hypothetical protein